MLLLMPVHSQLLHSAPLARRVIPCMELNDMQSRGGDLVSDFIALTRFATRDSSHTRVINEINEAGERRE